MLTCAHQRICEMNESVKGVIGLSKEEMLQATSLFLRSMGRSVVAVDIVDGFNFAVKDLTSEELRFEEETNNEALRLIREHNMLEAVKYYRGRTGCSLRESYDYVQNLAVKA